MDSNTITNPTKGIVKSPKLSHLTNDQLLKAMQYDMVEEHEAVQQVLWTASFVLEVV